jgi:hypothetical protein
VPSATRAKKRSAANKESPRACAKRSKKRNKDGKKAAKMSAAKPKKMSAVGSGTLDYKATGALSILGGSLGQSRLQRPRSLPLPPPGHSASLPLGPRTKEMRVAPVPGHNPGEPQSQ